MGYGKTKESFSEAEGMGKEINRGRDQQQRLTETTVGREEGRGWNELLVSTRCRQRGCHENRQ